MDIHAHVDMKMRRAMTENMKRMKPKGGMGMAQMEKIGRDYKNVDAISQKMMRKRGR